MTSALPSSFRALARRALLVMLAVLVGLMVQPRVERAGPGDGPLPFLNEPCRSVHYYPVMFAESPGGDVEAVFDFAGGAFHGRRVLSAGDARLASSHDAYVTDVQLGTYEPADPSQPNSPLICRLDRTFHFLCPATGTLDQLCYTWVARAVSTARQRPIPEPAAREQRVAVEEVRL